ncbi:MAG TPA: DUF2510 domain-containing protein [Streptosporangiaceae bacterium]
MANQVPAGWYPDPSGQPGQRYWDGVQWTADTTAVNMAEISAVLAEVGIQPRHGDGTPFGEPVVVVDQCSIDTRTGYRYDLWSGSGNLLAQCTEDTRTPDVDTTPLGEAIKQNNTDRVRFHDPSGRVWAQLAHRKTWKSKITVTGPDGRELGLITQKNVIGRVRFDVTAGGQKLAQLRSTNTRLAEFGITDQTGTTVGRILKLGNYASWRPLRDAKAIGRYVLDLPVRLPQPLITLALVAPVAVDLAFNPSQAGYRNAERLAANGFKSPR